MCLCSLPRSCATQKGYLVIVQDALQYKLLYGVVKLIKRYFFKILTLNRLLTHTHRFYAQMCQYLLPLSEQKIYTYNTSIFSGYPSIEIYPSII